MPGNLVGRRFPWRPEDPEAPTLLSSTSLHEVTFSSSEPSYRHGNSADNNKGDRKKTGQTERLKIHLP